MPNLKCAICRPQPEPAPEPEPATTPSLPDTDDDDSDWPFALSQSQPVDFGTPLTSNEEIYRAIRQVITTT